MRPVINAEGNSLVRHTTISAGCKAGAAALLSATVAAFVTFGGSESAAASQSGALDAQRSSLTTAAGSAIFSPAPQRTALTPALVGLLSRQGVPPTAYRAAEGGYDVQGTHDAEGNNDSGDVSWAELQPAAGGAIATNNAIDQAIADVTGWNAANPGHRESLKIRIVVGVHSPAWALNLGGQCFMVTDPNSGASGCCPRFWTAAFSAAYYHFEAALAAKYDGVPLIGEIVMAKNTTVYNESLIRQTQSHATIAALLAAGYSSAIDKQQQVQDIASLGTYWRHIHVGFAFNPYQNANPVSQDEAFTEQLIAGGRVALGAQLVLENNSIRATYLTGSGNYQSMYACMGHAGGLIAFQTSTIGRTGSLTAVLDGAIALGASSVELPSGYQAVLSPAQAAAISNGLG